MADAETNVLIIGSGGREDALAWKFRQSPAVNKIFVAPGNGGTHRYGTPVDIGAEDTDRLVNFAKDHHIDLTVIGPEGPLAHGIVDAFNESFLSAFGPTQNASRLESDKAWAGAFVKQYNIPHPKSRSFTDHEAAITYLQSIDPRTIVIKASGLAAGKGVILPETHDEALTTISAMMQEGRFGDSGETIVIQERLVGPEISVLAFCDGNTVIPLLPAQDHKRIFDGDKGPNTGGMGAYAPVPFVTPELMNHIHKTILQPTVDGMEQEGSPYHGILYAGLMLTKDGPKVLEYNARFGDPETQPLLMLLSSDLTPILLSCIEGTLKREQVAFHSGAAVCVVLASGEYPGNYQKGQEIFGFDTITDPNVIAFQAGTLMENDTLVTSGGRVLGITARADTMAEALKKAYRAIGPQRIHFSGMHYRTDIGNAATKEGFPCL